VSQDSDLTRKISFQSSFRNFITTGEGAGLLERVAAWVPGVDELLAFGSVTLIAHAAVHSRALKLWRESLTQPLATGDVVTGGQIGNLQVKPKWIQFNLANPRRRAEVIGDAIGLIRRVALPYLDRFAEPVRVIDGLLDGTMPWMWEPGALEYTSCFGTLQQAHDLLWHYLRMRPNQIEEYRRFISEYRENGIPEAFDSAAPGRLAKAALVLGLELDLASS
jgi:hypothetical protein